MKPFIYPKSNGALGVNFISSERPLIMIMGVGDLSTHVINQLLARPETSRLVLAGRDLPALQQRANLAKFAAANCGNIAEIHAVKADLFNIEETADMLARVKPDIIFMGASLQSWRRIAELPKAIFEQLDEAQFGPWLPMHLTLNYKLMQSVKASNIHTKVINAAFPDAVNPVLAQVNLAPDVGIGNISNIIPALTFAVSAITGIEADKLNLKLITQHYFSHFVPRYGHKGDGDYHLSVTDMDRNKIEFDHSEAFKMLNGPLKRLGGIAGQLLTAGSATRVISAIAENSNISAHTPGPNGLPGGYPVKINSDAIKIDLPPHFSLEEAIKINTLCQQADGIQSIEDDGSVVFTDKEMSIMKKILNYSVTRMSLSDTEEQAEELAAKFQEFRQQVEAGKIKVGRS